MAILVVGAVFVDIKGFPLDQYVPDGRNAGRVEYVHGGVARNVVEDIANIGFEPVFLSIVDETPMGQDVLDQLKKKNVHCNHVLVESNGMGAWLAVFDHNGEVAGSISQRPDLSALITYIDQNGDAIYTGIDSVVLQMDLDSEIVNRLISLAEKKGAKIYGIISNMNIAVERRELLKRIDCLLCNQSEAGVLFAENYDGYTPKDMQPILLERIQKAGIRSIVVTLGDKGSVYATIEGETGYCPAEKVVVKDTTGAGDSFGAGVVLGLSHGKTMMEACKIGTKLAASVITSVENVCPAFLPEELGLDKG